MNNLKILVFIALGVFSVIYTYYFRGAIPRANLGFFDGVVTTFVSTLLSIIVGIYLYEYQQRENKKAERERITSIINAESRDIVSSLSEGDEMSIKLPSSKDMSVLITLISPLAHEEAGKSGEFDALTTENIFHLSRKIRMYNMKVNHLMGLIQQNSNESYIKHAINNVNETKTAVVEACKLVKSQVNKA